jgi:hypothetical protein
MVKAIQPDHLKQLGPLETQLKQAVKLSGGERKSQPLQRFPAP